MTAHDVIARIARQVLRENYASIEDQADAIAAAIITDLELTEFVSVDVRWWATRYFPAEAES